jgi:hypothetical protein
MEAAEDSLYYFFKKLVDETQISESPEATRLIIDSSIP